MVGGVGVAGAEAVGTGWVQPASAKATSNSSAERRMLPPWVVVVCSSTIGQGEQFQLRAGACSDDRRIHEGRLWDGLAIVRSDPLQAVQFCGSGSPGQRPGPCRFRRLDRGSA